MDRNKEDRMSDKTTTTFSKGDQPRWIQMAPSIFQVEQGEDKDGAFAMVEGQAACYGNWFTVMDTGSYSLQRMNRPGMFARSLSQNPEIVLRVNHQDALARTGAGTLQVWETDQALMFKGRINLQMMVANDVYQAMKDDLLTEGSCQFWPTMVEEWSEEQDGKIVEYQDIKEAKIDKGDVSIVLYGANPQCSTNLAQMIQMARPLPVPAADDVPAEEKIIKFKGDTSELQKAVDEVEDTEPANDLLSEKERAIIQFHKCLLADPVKHLLVPERKL